MYAQLLGGFHPGLCFIPQFSAVFGASLDAGQEMSGTSSLKPELLESIARACLLV